MPPGPLSHRSARVAPLPELADVLEPDAPHDFAFADTVHVADLIEPPAPSARAIVHPLVTPSAGASQLSTPLPSVRPSFRALHDESPQALYASGTPLAFPLPESSAPGAALSTRLRVLWARVRHGVRGAIEELAELWEQTAYVATEDANARASATTEARVIARRVRALWASWEWDRSDLQRAAMIGLGVFAAATLAAAVLVAASDDGSRPTATASANESITSADGPTSQVVRAPRTLDQRTGRAQVVRGKARR